MTMILTDVDFMTIKELEYEIGWPLDYTSTKGLIPYIKRLGEKVQGIEIGTCRAESTYLLLESCPNIEYLLTIDPFLEYDDWSGKLDQETMDKFEVIARKNLEQFGDRAEILKSTCKDYCESTLTKAEFDFAFIDGDHSYKGALDDMRLVYDRVRKGGIFAGHDYHLEDVRKALEEFREERNIRIPLQKTHNSVWFWYV